MDFARKQLEKYGWKNGDGLGRTNQGIAIALKPHLKTGKEGMGFDISHELTDTWWTKAYSDSLSRINVTQEESAELIVTIKQEDDNTNLKTTDLEERPMEKMRRKMMKSNFTPFSKGGTLTNGELVEEETEANSNSNSGSSTPVFKLMSDEDLFKACGGRTLHKAARFGHKLTGKLARIAEQEKLIASQNVLIDQDQTDLEISSKKRNKKSKKRKHKEIEIEEEALLEIEDDPIDQPKEKSKKRKKKKVADVELELENATILVEEQISIENDCKLIKKKKKKSKDKTRKSETIEES